jgi:hypothetical protein
MNLKMCVCALLMTACGDALASENYIGEPLMTLDGALTSVSGVTIPQGARVSVLWHVAAEVSDGVGSLEGLSPVLSDVEIAQSGHLGRFAARLYEPPPAVALATPQGGGGRYALGVLFAYEDTNGNGQLDCVPAQFDPGIACTDKLLGGAPNAVIVYSEADWSADAQPLFSTTRHAEDLSITDVEAGVRPSKGWSLVHLDPVSGDHALGRICTCRTPPCALPPGRETGWECLEPGRLLSPLEAEPMARPWRPDDILELRVVHDVRDALFSSQLRFFEPSWSKP